MKEKSRSMEHLTDVLSAILRNCQVRIWQILCFFYIFGAFPALIIRNHFTHSPDKIRVS